MNVFFRKDHYFGRDLQSTIPGRTIFLMVGLTSREVFWKGRTFTNLYDFDMTKRLQLKIPCHQVVSWFSVGLDDCSNVFWQVLGDAYNSNLYIPPFFWGSHPTYSLSSSRRIPKLKWTVFWMVCFFEGPVQYPKNYQKTNILESMPHKETIRFQRWKLHSFTFLHEIWSGRVLGRNHMISRGNMTWGDEGKVK